MSKIKTYKIPRKASENPSFGPEVEFLGDLAWEAEVADLRAALVERDAKLLVEAEEYRCALANWNANMTLVKELRAENRELKARLTALEALSVTQIMLSVVPGDDGEGVEVYAESVGEVVDALSKMGSELEDWQLGIKRHPLFEAKIADLEAKLEALEKQDYVALFDIAINGGIATIRYDYESSKTKLKSGDKLYAAAGAAPVPVGRKVTTTSIANHLKKSPLGDISMYRDGFFDGAKWATKETP